MRSRYSAYAKRNPSYLSDSWHPDTRPPEVTVDRDRTWTGLRILASSGGGETDAIGIVEFIATSTSRTGTSSEPVGSVHEQHEVSRFERFEGHWVYVSED